MTEDIYSDLITQDNEEDLRFLELADKYLINAASTYAEKDYLLERNGIGFSPRGNVCAIAAEKKAGKTWFSMSLCAAYLKGEFLGMKSRHEEGSVLFFDTEQDEGDGQRIQRRVHFACGWDFNTNNMRFRIFHLREINAADRREFVNWAIGFYKAELVIVDGIRDLLSDFNDLEQSASVIQDFMRLSSQVNCCIWAVLHVNPNSEKMRGHLGSELGNKVADILYLTKKKDPNDEENTSYSMEETDARSHRDIDSITFRINDNVPYGAPQIMSKEESKKIDENIIQKEKEEINEIILKYLNINSGRSMKWTPLRDAVRAGEHIGQNKAISIVNKALEYDIIVKRSDGYISYNGLKSLTKTDTLFEENKEKASF